MGVFSRGTTRISGSLSCGAREVRSPCAWRGGQPSPWVGPGKPNLPLGLRGKAGGCARVTAGPKGPHLGVWMWFGAFPGAFGLGRAQPQRRGTSPCQGRYSSRGAGSRCAEMPPSWLEALTQETQSQVAVRRTGSQARQAGVILPSTGCVTQVGQW